MKVEFPLTPRAADFDAAYFDTIYRNYRRQNPPRKMRFYRDLIARHGGRPGSILDVGCAFGMFLNSLPAEWKRHGIDISEHAIGKASAGDPSIAFAPAILETNPFAGPFDVVTSFDVIEHIPDRDAALDHLNALVKPRSDARAQAQPRRLAGMGSAPVPGGRVAGPVPFSTCTGQAGGSAALLPPSPWWRANRVESV